MWLSQDAKEEEEGKGECTIIEARMYADSRAAEGQLGSCIGQV